MYTGALHPHMAGTVLYCEPRKWSTAGYLEVRILVVWGLCVCCSSEGGRRVGDVEISEMLHQSLLVPSSPGEGEWLEGEGG